MKTTSLVLVLSTDGLTGDDAALRTALWSQVSELLQPTLGRVCKRFEPAVEAWRQKIDQDYGILLGRSDPALFLYFYSSGRHRQEEAVQYHLHGMLDSSQVATGRKPKPHGSIRSRRKRAVPWPCRPTCSGTPP